MKMPLRYWLLVAPKRWLAGKLVQWAVQLGAHSPYYDGLPAALELEDIEYCLDEIGVPREVGAKDPWPLAPRQRARWLRDALQAMGVQVKPS